MPNCLLCKRRGTGSNGYFFAYLRSSYMPYNISFERIIKTDNSLALELNKRLAGALIATFSEIHDLNTITSGAHFTQFEIDSEDEFSERHFSLWGDLEEMLFGFEFWKDTLWIDLGPSGNPNIRFAHVRQYAEFIVQHGFTISGVSSPAILTLDAAIEEHLGAYKEWVGFVDYVIQTVSAKALGHRPQ
jgi:hypothetical protein